MEKKKEIRIPWGTGIVGYVAESGESVNIPDAYKVSIGTYKFLYLNRLLLKGNKIMNAKFKKLNNRPTDIFF